jgi:hypothetical protein
METAEAEMNAKFVFTRHIFQFFSATLSAFSFKVSKGAEKGKKNFL